MLLLFNSWKKLAAVVAVAAAGALAGPAATLASGPVITYDNDTTPLTIEDWGDCPGFQINATFMAQRRNEDFLDAQGNLILERRHVDFTGTLYNAAEPSHALDYEGHFTRTLNLSQGRLTINGLMAHVIVPGSGAILLAAGDLSVDLDSGDVVRHGPDGDLDALCAALS
jgi:hypothetical protein